MLEQVEAGHFVQDLKMNVLQAIYYIIRAWRETSAETISNSWKHTKILPTNADSLNNTQRTNDPVINELVETLDALRLPTVMGVEEFLTLPDENVVYETPEDDQALANLFRIENSTEENESSDDDSVEIPIIAASTALKNLDSVKMFLLQQENTSEQLKLLGKLESFIEERKIDQLQQSYIDNYFVKTVY